MIRGGPAVPHPYRQAAAGIVLGAGVVLALGACTSFSAVAADAADSGADAASDANSSAQDARSEAGSAPGAYAAAVLRDAPIAYFRLDDVGVVETGSIFDEISKSHFGAVHGKPVFGAAGAIGNGVAFDGAAWIELGDRYGFPGVAPFTIEVFVKPSGTSFGHVFTKQQRANPKNGYAVTTDTALVMERFLNGGSSKTPPQTLSTNEFWHVACTFDGTKMAVYVNGTPRGKAADSDDVPAQSSPAIIGAASTSGEYGFDGTIDELAIYDKALDPSQIAAHYLAR